eukprot:Ihof_evm4s444 gene=Ihof_evmTU4s444
MIKKMTCGKGYLLTIIRHGETLANTQGILQGQMDTPLNETGLKQAEALGKAMTQAYKFEIIYSSDLQRALHTAKCVHKGMPDVPLKLEARLKEKGCGVVEGQHYGAAAEMAQAAGVDYKDFVPEGAESQPVFQHRISDFLNDTFALHAIDMPVAKTAGLENGKLVEKLVEESMLPIIAIVTHGGVMHALMKLLGHKGIIPGNASVSQFLIT